MLIAQLDYPANSNRLAKASVAGISTRSFAYDAAGNTVTELRGRETLSFTYNLCNRPVTVTRAGSGLKVTPDLDVTVEGDAPAPIPADRDAEYTLTVKGRAPSKPNLPPRPYQTTLTLALRPEEHP